MKLWQIVLSGIIFVFLFSFITHNIYDWFPSKLTSIFFPVNESIWEHQKMIYITNLLWGFIAYLLLKKYNLNYHNIILATIITAIANIIIFLIIYTPIYAIWGHDFIVTLVIYLITIIISYLINYKVLMIDHYYKILNYPLLILAIILWFIFGIFTYYPLHWELLFFDTYHQKYGIYNYYN